MTPTQQAMCAVIRESGRLDLKRFKTKSYNLTFHLIDGWTPDEHVQWEMELDGHTLTQQEYEEWEKQQN